MHYLQKLMDRNRIILMLCTYWYLIISNDSEIQLLDKPLLM